MRNQMSWETRKKMLKKKGWELIKDGNDWAYVNNSIMYFVQDFKDMDDNAFNDIAVNGE